MKPGAEEGPGSQNKERRVSRGLEQVSHLFFTAAEEGAPARDPVPETSAPEPPSELPPGPESGGTVALLPRRFLSRGELLSFLKAQPGSLEEGLRSLETGIPCDGAGSIELLARDSAGQLVIVDFDDSPNNELLVRGLAHLDWLVQNMPSAGRIYGAPPTEIILPPRLVFVAPDFSPLFRRAVRQITPARIDCFRYHAVASGSGTGIFFERVCGGAV